MSNYIKKYRPFLLFLSKFLITYLVLVFLYQQYLNQFDASKQELDSVTKIVAYNAKTILNGLGYKTSLAPNPLEPSFKVYVEGIYLVRIIEGCNAISVMILFVAFIVAFSGKFLQTALFIIVGLIVLYVLNIGRIVLLTIGILTYPKYLNILHDIIFPLFIYGVVFILWVVWINKFSLYAKKNMGQ